MFRYPIVDLTGTGQNIVRLRKKNGLSVKDVQEALGLATPQAVYKWQRGDTLPTVDNLLVLSVLFGVSIDAILVTRCA